MDVKTTFTDFDLEEDVVVLPVAPNFPETEHIDLGISTKRTRGNIPIPHHTGNIDNRLSFSFEGVPNITETIDFGNSTIYANFVDDLISFLIKYTGKRIKIQYEDLEENDQEYVGIVVTPILEIVTVRDVCHYDVTFELLLTDEEEDG